MYIIDSIVKITISFFIFYTLTLWGTVSRGYIKFNAKLNTLKQTFVYKE